LTGLYYFRHRGIVALASQNFDGEWIARILQRFGYRLARGSSSRGGARALMQMRRDLIGGRPVVFTVDGPRGPARVAQSGAAWLAGVSGQPILPFHTEASRSWTTSSWDHGQIPRPLSAVAVVVGTPIEVPVIAERCDWEPTIERTRAELECALERLEMRARSLLEQH
jgi:lysophospholipid acyltransferase (LPLAT)-like uncharacterized protein